MFETKELEIQVMSKLALVKKPVVYQYSSSSRKNL